MQEKIKRVTYNRDRKLGIEIIPIDNKYITKSENLDCRGYEKA